MRKSIFFLALFIATNTSAQTEADIRKHYQDVNKKIAESIEQGTEGPLYRNQWITNNHGKSWPVIVRYTDSVNFWYNDPPDRLPASKRDPKKTLLKIEINGISGGMYKHEEFLFQNGILIFYFADLKEEGMGIEQRVWFNYKGVAIKKSSKANELEIKPNEPEYSDVAPNVANVLKEGKKYQDLFVKSML